MEDIANSLTDAGRLIPRLPDRFDGIIAQLTEFLLPLSSDCLALTCCFEGGWRVGIIAGPEADARMTTPPTSISTPAIGTDFYLHTNRHCPLDELAESLPQDWLRRFKEIGIDHVCFFPERIREYGAWFYTGKSYQSPEWTSLLNFTAQLAVTALGGANSCTANGDFQQDEVLEREFGDWLQARNPELLTEMLGSQLADQFGLDQSIFLFKDCSEKQSTTLHANGIEVHKIEAILAGVKVGGSGQNRLYPQLKPLSGVDNKAVAANRELAGMGFQYSLSVPTEDGDQVVGIIGRGDNRRLSIPEQHRLERWLCRFKLALDNQRRIAHLEALSYTDATTGIFNCRFFKRRLGEEITRARRFDRPLSLVIFDLDDFKILNDTYGHLAGDQILREIAELLLVTIRSIDIACRYGGDEFVVIMPETEGKDCICFTHRLQRTILDHTFRLGRGGENEQISVSMGTAVFPSHADGPERLFWCADMAMLSAKEAGRNQVVMYEPGMYNPTRPLDR